MLHQNYYFVYYIDLSITNENVCDVKKSGSTEVGLYGNCNGYTGYAFATLNRIKEIASFVVEQYNYFVSENNNQFNQRKRRSRRN